MKGLANFFNLDRIKNYLKDSLIELKKVKWLTRQETINLTLEVLIFSFIFLVIYGIFDYLFVSLLFRI
ncbi:MAG: preprotein translocase subunit SecE [Patescibacteria group bacterium]|nr:preprotein translocase subunit SecE [Patescibacteria group bacterium]